MEQEIKKENAPQQLITPFLWFNDQAETAARFYTDLFKNSSITDIVWNTGSSPAGEPGTVLTVGFNLEGLSFNAMNGGPSVTFSPAISFFVTCETEKEIDYLYAGLSGGKVYMPLQKYPFSEKYAWIGDQFGVSWQLMLGKNAHKITPSLLFAGKLNGKAEEAMRFYASVFKKSAVENAVPYETGENEGQGGIKYGSFQLADQHFVAMDSQLQQGFTFNESISFVINCQTQDEIDYYWGQLTQGGAEVECGWLVDQFGVYWQVVPLILTKLLQDKDRARADRAMKAMLGMKKLNIEELERA